MRYNETYERSLQQNGFLTIIYRPPAVFTTKKRLILYPMFLSQLDVKFGPSLQVKMKVTMYFRILLKVHCLEVKVMKLKKTSKIL